MIRIIREMVGYMRGERPEPLPDNVTWTVEYLDRAQAQFGMDKHTANGWTVKEYDGNARVVFHRTDGAYRWRDDGFEGF